MYTLRIPVPIPPWSIILNVNINNLTPTERSQADPTLLQVANGYFIYRIAYYFSFSSPHSVMLSLAVPLSSDSPLYTLLFCFPNGFSIFLWLQKPPNYGGPLAFIPIFKLLVDCSPPFFSSAVLASFANFSFAIHDLLTLFAADCITWILYKLVKFWTVRPHLDICCYPSTEFRAAMRACACKRRKICWSVLMLTCW